MPRQIRSYAAGRNARTSGNGLRKYRNNPTEFNGRKFDSQKEARRAGELQLLERLGEIEDLDYQIAFPFDYNGIRLCKYIADFVYYQNGQRVVEDVKSAASKTPLYNLKKKMMKAFHGVEILET